MGADSSKDHSSRITSVCNWTLTVMAIAAAAHLVVLPIASHWLIRFAGQVFSTSCGH